MAIRQSLDSESREKLAELVRALPEREVRQRLGGIAFETVTRALAGLPVQRGTIALVRAGLAQSGGQAA
jgi:hypothetical protein